LIDAARRALSFRFASALLAYKTASHKPREMIVIQAKHAAIFIVLISVFLAAPSQAQSTLADPVPLQGNQAESIARTAALNGAMGNGTYTSPAEFARRKQQGQAASNCKKNARDRYPAGDQRRKNAVAQCQRVFAAQRATWYDPAKKLP
jgi:hypothetical protein